MENVMGEINILAVVVASAVGFVFAGIWFGVVIAKPYSVALGREKMPPQKPTALLIVGPFLCTLFTTITSAILMRMLHIDTLAGGLSFGALVGVGYILATCQNIAINPNFPRPFFYTLLNAPYFVLNSLITCGILALMSK
jgi:hypothetical protein